MVDYRISKLLRAAAYHVRAIFNARDPKGILFYSLILRTEEPYRRRLVGDLTHRYRDQIWSVFGPFGPVAIINMFARSVGEAEDRYLGAIAMPGVESGSLTFFKGIVEPGRPNWIDRLVDEKIAAGRGSKIRPIEGES